MKASDNFAFDQKWWSKNKPLTLKKTGLGDVLKEYGTLLGTARDFADAGTFKGITSAKSPIDLARGFVTQKVRPAVKKAKDACNKTMHADAIAVLGKYDAAEKKELGTLDSMEQLFEKAYSKKVDPLLKKAAALKKESLDAAVEGEKVIVAAKKEAKAIETLADAFTKNSNPQAKQKLYLESLKRLATVESGMKSVDQLLKQAGELLSSIGKQATADFLPRDVSTINELSNDANAAKNQLTRCQNDVRSLHATAEADVQDMASSFDGKGPSLEEALASLKKVSVALKGFGEDSRRLDNNLTGAILVLVQMAKAKAQEQKGVDLHEAAKALSIPLAPESWAKQCTTWKGMGAEMTKKNNELLARATEIRKKAVARLTDEQKKDKNVAKEIAGCAEYIKEVTAYVETIAGHDTQLKSAITKLGY